MKYVALRPPKLVRWSLSSRRAWIEISPNRRAIRARPSLSSRRAWIEIHTTIYKVKKYGVALLTESVD